MKTKHALPLCASVLSALALAACKKASGPAVAHVGADVITAEEFKRRMDEQSPFVRARFNALERKKELLDALIRNELLAQEAQREGLDKSPAVREAARRAMIQELIKKQFDEKMSGADLGDNELRAFYDAHVDDFVKPERARVYHIFLPIKNAKEKAAARAKVAALFKEIEARQKKGEPNAFQAVALRESKDQLSAPMGGDLRFLTKEELTRSHGPELANAAFELKNPGDILGPIETATGVELVKLQVKTVALNRSFDESKDSIRGRIARERRSKEFDEFVKKLREQSKVSIDEVQLAKVNPAEGATPGAMPLAHPQPAPAQPAPAPASAKIGGN
jgi:parvulin-like peptidyl-prolyl isomerase